MKSFGRVVLMEEPGDLYPELPTRKNPSAGKAVLNRPTVPKRNLSPQLDTIDREIVEPFIHGVDPVVAKIAAQEAQRGSQSRNITSNPLRIPLGKNPAGLSACRKIPL